MAFDAANFVHRSVIRPAASDLLGTAVYTQPGQPRSVVEDTVERELDAVRCVGWWADRCRVDLFGLGSETGTTVRLKLLCSNVDKATSWVTVLNRSVVVPAKTLTDPLTLTLGIASGWLAQWWLLVGSVANAGEVCTFSARYTLDLGRAGLYSAGGDGTAP